MSSVLVDYRTSPMIRQGLIDIGVQVLQAPRCEALPRPVNGHPDLMLHKVTDDVAVVAPNVFREFIELGRVNGSNWSIKTMIRGKVELGDTYPGDVPYNFLRIGNLCVGKIDSMDPKLMEQLKGLDVEFVNSRQGYAQCSVAKISESCCITADKGMERLLKAWGIQVLRIPEGGITLEGYNHGFIGGASGVISGRFVLTGRFHDAGINRAIEDFVTNNGVDIRFLTVQEPVDLGSLIPV